MYPGRHVVCATDAGLEIVGNIWMVSERGVPVLLTTFEIVDTADMTDSVCRYPDDLKGRDWGDTTVVFVFTGRLCVCVGVVPLVIWKSEDFEIVVTIVDLKDRTGFDVVDAECNIVVLNVSDVTGVEDGVCETASASIARQVSSTMFRLDWANNPEHELVAHVWEVERNFSQAQAPWSC